MAAGIDFSSLFEPVRLGPVTLKNRYAMAPTSDIQEEGGLPNEQTYAFLAARARGGAALVHVGSVQATERAFLGQDLMQHRLYHPAHSTRYAEAADTIRWFGAAAFIQLIAGFGSFGTPPDGSALLSASDVPCVEPVDEMPETMARLVRRMQAGDSSRAEATRTPRALTRDEIHEEQDAFARSVRLAAMADFDGIEIHACHEMLVHQFRSAATNRRTDEYGGSLENRNRFLLELVEKSLAALRPDFPGVAVGVRLSARDYVEGGVTFAETLDLTRTIAEMGVDYLDVSNAGPSSWRHFMPDVDATNVEFARGVKEASGLPVLCNNLHDPLTALRAVTEGAVDVVAVTRPLIADPELPDKVREGRVHDVVRCTRCYLCDLRIINGMPVRCPVNPDVGREKYVPQNWRGGTVASRLVPPLMRRRGEVAP